MAFGLTRPFELPEVERAELEQLVTALQQYLDVEHNAEGRQRVTGVQVETSASQALTTGVLTRVLWRVPKWVGDTDGVALLSDETGQVRITRPGVYDLHTQIRWSTNATGYRRVEIQGADTARLALDTRAAFASIQVVQSAYAGLKVTTPTVISVWALQTSGGNLDIDAGSDTWLRVQRVG